MKTFIFLFALVFAFSFQSFSQWSLVPSTGTAGINIEKISFSDPNNGVLIGSYSFTGSRDVFVSTDAGLNWSTMNPPSFASTDFQDIFLSQGTCYLSVRSVSSGGMRVFKSTNTGVNWTDVSPDTSNLGYGESTLFFADAMNGWFGVGDAFYKTTNAGTNWTEFNTGPWSPKDIDFVDVNHGMVGLWDGTFAYTGEIMTTTDGGTTWSTLVLNGMNTMVEAVCNAAPGEGYTYGSVFSPNYFLRTGNGWQSHDSLALNTLDTTLYERPSALDFLAGGKGWIATSHGRIIYTVDGGDSWVQEKQADSLELTELEITGNVVYAAGSYGRLYKRDILNNRQTSPASAIGLKVFPNPVRSGGLLHILSEGSAPVSHILLRDITGKEILRLEESVIKGSITFPEINPGMYILEADGVFVSKLVVIE